MKWVAILLTIVLATLYAVASTVLLPGILIIFLSGSGAPGASVFPGLALLLLYLALYVSPILILIFLFLKKKFPWIVFFNALVIVSIIVFGGEYIRQPIEILIGKAGVPLPDSAPAGILTLSTDAIPDGYYIGEKGEVGTFAGKKIYTKAFYTGYPPKGHIRLMYYLQRYTCAEFNTADHQDAVCKVGRCVTRTHSSAVSGGKTNFQSKDTSFAIDDNGACVRISFNSNNEKEALTHDQIMKVVDSLERVPGEREISSETEQQQATLASSTSSGEAIEIFLKLRSVRASLEEYKKERGSYKDYILRQTMEKPTYARCPTIMSLDISPDGNQYVLHQFVCPDMEKSYCTESGRTDILTTPTSLIRETYHCQ